MQLLEQISRNDIITFLKKSVRKNNFIGVDIINIRKYVDIYLKLKKTKKYVIIGFINEYSSELNAILFGKIEKTIRKEDKKVFIIDSIFFKEYNDDLENICFFLNKWIFENKIYQIEFRTRKNSLETSLFLERNGFFHSYNVYKKNISI